MIDERFILGYERILLIEEENVIEEPFAHYFRKTADFILLMIKTFSENENRNWEQTSLQGLGALNHKLYEDILKEQYENSYANPVFATAKLGEYGKLLSFLYTELRSLIPWVFELNKEELVIRMELFLEVYHAFYASYEELDKPPVYEDMSQIIYWFISDYTETEVENRIKEQLDPDGQFAMDIIMNSDLSSSKYLYRFGEYITENEIKTVLFLNSLPEATIRKIADTYTEAYRIGFLNNNKDLSKKKVVNIRYNLGFERVVKTAIGNFEKMGLRPTIYRAGVSAFHKRGVHKIGYYGAVANKQYEYDHKEDDALYLDKNLIQRRLEVLKEAYELEKEWAYVHAGPACIELFGEEPFAPVSKKEACSLSDYQQKMAVEYASKTGQITNDYIKGEERSFTIIAFPSPEIGDKYEEIFEEIIQINTLDYKLYEGIQQTLINALDKAAYVKIQGMNHNHTDMQISLATLSDPTKQTIFENCVADVNIPVGEVFTSPALLETKGTLHVTKVFLNELEYTDLEILFEEGYVTAYTCKNFQKEEENKKYIRDNVLFHHESLPIGEFAIGTNTRAYVMAEKFGIANKLPILIAEKTGPHFALGDTCYSHSEEVAVYNPDGKEIVARDNETSILRKTDLKKAYFNCHTDITIPYDELGRLYAVTAIGEEIPIIEQGRFVLPGTEELNMAFL